MGERVLRSRSVVAGILATLLATVGLVAGPAATAATAADPTLTFTGHGWGHGRGMGQWGALGYAVDHGWGYAQILGHYYGGTSLQANAGNPEMSVELTGLTGKDTIVTGVALTVGTVPSNSSAVLVRRTSPGMFTAWTGPGCGGPWTAWGTFGSASAVASAADPANPDNLPRVCESTGTQAYRGVLQFVDVGGTQYTINRLPTEDYLRGVVPRESPASWGTAGGGRGMEALKAQSVAARSYALAGGSRSSGALTCDTTSCQVYEGAATYAANGARTDMSAATTDQAIAATAGQVMRHSSGQVARTEFSSSTGGWSAGGTFPAVEDLGDATAGNGHHTWTTTLAQSRVAQLLGVPDIQTIAVVSRNGLGQDGGRVTSLMVTSSAGTRTFTGSQVRSALSLQSDWFTVSGVTVTAATAVVKALYRDILGRDPDPTGLATWTQEITRTSGASTTAAALVGSTERLQTIVAEQYRAALNREPEPEGTTFWVGLFQSGWNVPDLQAGIYGSDEAVLNLGGGDEMRWVAAMYQAVLGRAATESECRWWLDYAHRNGRQAAVRGITRSEEAALVRLNGYYQTMLGRGPDPSGIATFVPVLMNGRGDLILPALIGQSSEYWDRAQTRFP
ncbi:SpoIID/LytB domain-containing protein [Cellulomonas soli]